MVERPNAKRVTISNVVRVRHFHPHHWKFNDSAIVAPGQISRHTYQTWIARERMRMDPLLMSRLEHYLGRRKIRLTTMLRTLSWLTQQQNLLSFFKPTNMTPATSYALFHSSRQETFAAFVSRYKPTPSDILRLMLWHLNKKRMTLRLPLDIVCNKDGSLVEISAIRRLARHVIGTATFDWSRVKADTEKLARKETDKFQKFLKQSVNTDNTLRTSQTDASTFNALLRVHQDSIHSFLSDLMSTSSKVLLIHGVDWHGHLRTSPIHVIAAIYTYR